MRATATDLVVWQDDAGEPAAVALRNPDTGEVVDLADAAAVASWIVAVREWQDAVVDTALALAGDALNAHLDHIGATRTTVETADGHAFDIAGETAGAARQAIAVPHPAELRQDLDVLVSRGALSAEAADGACHAEETITWRTHTTKIRTLLGRGDVVAETIAHHVEHKPRTRKRPTVKRVRA